jgi:hypothetical protein
MTLRIRQLQEVTNLVLPVQTIYLADYKYAWHMHS